MAAAGAKTEGDGGASKDTRVSIPAPLSPAKPALVQLVGTLNTLWGSDRVLRTAQFAGRFVGRAIGPHESVMLRLTPIGGAAPTKDWADREARMAVDVLGVE